MDKSKYLDKYFKIIIVTMLQISENIALARKKRGLKQEEVAQKLGMSRSTYANWEKSIEPSLTDIVRISEILDIPVAELIGQDMLLSSSERRMMAYIMKINADTIALKGAVANLISQQQETPIQFVIGEIEKSVSVALEKMRQE
jgi:transcriptional regulator with XRE-family HTH domain